MVSPQLTGTCILLAFSEQFRNIIRIFDKTNKMTVCPAKTQISLGVRLVWSRVFAVHSMEDLSFLHVASKDSDQTGQIWSNWADAQADLSLGWAYMPFCWFCHAAAHLYYCLFLFVLFFSCLTLYEEAWIKGNFLDVEIWKLLISREFVSYEPSHEKMCLTSYANNKDADQPAHPRSLISAFVVHCLDRIISLDSIAEISRL